MAMIMTNGLPVGSVCDAAGVDGWPRRAMFHCTQLPSRGAKEQKMRSTVFLVKRRAVSGRKGIGGWRYTLHTVTENWNDSA